MKAERTQKLTFGKPGLSRTSPTQTTWGLACVVHLYSIICS